jgi:hypothetical protein
MTPQEIEALPALPEIDHTGLVRVQRQTQSAEQDRRPTRSVLSLLLRRAQHHEIIRETDELPDTVLVPGPIERVQVDVGQQRGDYSSNAMGNFCFEVSLSYRRLERLPRVTGGL